MRHSAALVTAPWCRPNFARVVPLFDQGFVPRDLWVVFECDEDLREIHGNDEYRCSCTQCRGITSI